MTPKGYDTTVARIAGNSVAVAWELLKKDAANWNSMVVCSSTVAAKAVRIARAIVEETKRTEPTTGETRT